MSDELGIGGFSYNIFKRFFNYSSFVTHNLHPWLIKINTMPS